jgi:hypothetical protein
MTNEQRRRIRAAILEDRKRPHEERWQEMIDRGWIDAKGNVLLPSIAPTDSILKPDPEPEADVNGQHDPNA